MATEKRRMNQRSYKPKHAFRKGQVVRGIGCRFYIWLFLLLSAGVLAYGQTDRATITGTVKDQAGAVLPGATVTATNADTMAMFTGLTNGDGIYTIPSLPVGHYKLVVARDGFRT